MRKLWILLIAVVVFSFALLGWVGSEIFRQAPPIPREVVTTDGTVVVPDQEILNGQNVWQAMGGMQVGSIWGHGSYVAPDWTADYLHREALFILNEWTGGKYGQDGAAMASEQRAALLQRLQDLMRKNTYDEASGKLILDPIRARAFEDNLKHYSEVFTNGRSDCASF
jgi:nitric oxide reductase subunit B